MDRSSLGHWSLAVRRGLTGLSVATTLLLGAAGAASAETANAGNGGTATASANGGSVTIGNINSGGNRGNTIVVGHTKGSVVIHGGTVTTTTSVRVSANGGVAVANARGGNNNVAVVR